MFGMYPLMKFLQGNERLAMNLAIYKLQKVRQKPADHARENQTVIPRRQKIAVHK